MLSLLLEKVGFMLAGKGFKAFWDPDVGTLQKAGEYGAAFARDV